MNIKVPRRLLVVAPSVLVLASGVVFAAPAHASGTGPGATAIVITDSGGAGQDPQAVLCPSDPPIIRG